MNEFIVTLIFIVLLVSGVYLYAGYLTRTGKAEDADGNFIPDSWEEKFGWFFNAKGLIMLVLGLVLVPMHGGARLPARITIRLLGPYTKRLVSPCYSPEPGILSAREDSVWNWHLSNFIYSIKYDFGTLSRRSRFKNS